MGNFTRKAKIVRFHHKNLIGGLNGVDKDIPMFIARVPFNLYKNDKEIIRGSLEVIVYINKYLPACSRSGW